MKGHLKYQTSILVGFIYLISIIINPININAETSIHSKCGYIPEDGVNPSVNMINCLLTEVAISNNVPPEVVKAVAEKESGWKQFTDVGEPLVSKDGGIGIMQITWTNGFDVEKLKMDIVYNIEAGIQMLSDNFSRKDLPQINDGARDVIENWYFAIMGFNGTKPMNSPIYQKDGTTNSNAYQEKVFELIEKQSLLDMQPIQFKTTDFLYDTENAANIQFVTKQFKIPTTQLNRSKYYYKPMDKGYIAKNEVRLRQEPITTSPIVKVLNRNDKVTILDTFIFDPINSANTFAWNRIKLEDGTEGYVAASYINETSSTTSGSETDNNTGTSDVVPTNKIWTIEFNSIVDRNSVDQDTVYILDSNGKNVRTVLTVNGKNVVITPVEKYESGKTYTLYVKRVKSAAGIPLSPEVNKVFTIQ